MSPPEYFRTLLPYREARQIDAESDPGDSPVVWPEPDADNLCALEGRYFDRTNDLLVTRLRVR